MGRIGFERSVHSADGDRTSYVPGCSLNDKMEVTILEQNLDIVKPFGYVDYSGMETVHRGGFRVLKFSKESAKMNGVVGVGHDGLIHARSGAEEKGIESDI